MDHVKRIWYLSPMRAAKVQASLRIRTVSPEPSLLAHTSSESRGTFRQKARSLAPLNGWACAVTICHDGMLEDTNSLDGAHICKILCCIKIYGTNNMNKGCSWFRIFVFPIQAIYEGCSESSWNLVIKFSNINIILSFYEILQVDIYELASRS